MIEDVPGDTDFIDRVSRCVLVEGLPSTSSATRRTIASVMGGFGVLQSQLELRPKVHHRPETQDAQPHSWVSPRGM